MWWLRSGRAVPHPQQLFQFPFLLRAGSRLSPSSATPWDTLYPPLCTTPGSPGCKGGPGCSSSSKIPTYREHRGFSPTAVPRVPACSPPDCLRGSTQGRAASHTATRHTQGVQTPPFSCHTPSQQETAPEALQRPTAVEADRPFSSSPPLWAGKGTEPTPSAAPHAWPHSCLPRLLPARLMHLGFPFTLEQFPKLPGLRAARFWP